MGRFQIVGEDAILDGRCTDIYFKRVVDVMEKDGVNPHVTMEVTAAALPDRWGVLCGLDDVVRLLERLPVDVDAMPEGSVSALTRPAGGLFSRQVPFWSYCSIAFFCGDDFFAIVHI